MKDTTDAAPKYFRSVPTYTLDTDEWTHTHFETREQMRDFVQSMFKEPGQYEFDEISYEFNRQARLFNKTRVYCLAPYGTKDFITYWDSEKDKSRNGVIFHHKGKTWYLPRDYYFWINFLPIYNKEVADFTFADVRDVQYHMALYEDLAMLSYKHAAILKKRQIASSYYHAGKMLNYFWFEPGWINKMAGSLKDYINEKGTWRFLEEYRNFLNQHTAWYRPCTPDKVLNWEQKVEVNQNGRKTDRGLKSVIIGLVLEKNPTNGVGGPCNLFFHEEAGIAPQMSKTAEYLMPALKSGMIYTGMMCVAGSVGDLQQCEPLRDMIYNPDGKDVLAVPTQYYNCKIDMETMARTPGEVNMCGLFIPEQWSMIPCIDKYGNSLVEEAIKMILEERKSWKRKLTPQDYQLRISQKPITIQEAFDSRTESKFPLHLVTAQRRRIEEKAYFLEHCDIIRNAAGNPELTPTNKRPIAEFPISPKTLDKEGCLVIHERPVPGAPWGTYYASIDPVAEGKTTTSESLCSIYIYKNPMEIRKIAADGSFTSHVEQGKLVAWWCGRFDDLKKTHERLELMVELYEAWTLVENNISLFIQHMIEKRKMKYLVPKDQCLFLKELGANANVFQDYGWKNTGTLFKTNMLSYGSQFCSEILDEETSPEGDVLRQVFGVERIPDIMLLQEMSMHRDKLNVDRLVAFCALVAFVAVQMAAKGGYVKKTEYESPEQLQNLNKNAKLIMSPFRHVGGTGGNSAMRRPRNPYRNIR
jgi:hypothetical protein